MDIEFAEIPRPDEKLRHDVLHRHDRLGTLAHLGAWIAACQGRSSPQPLRRPRVVVFAAGRDPSSHSEDTPSSQTAGGIPDILWSGDYPLHTLAAEAGIGVRTVDLERDAADPTVPTSGQQRVTGTTDDRNEPNTHDVAVAERTLAMVRTGMAMADAEVDAGADLLIPAELNSTSMIAAATVIAARTGAEPVEVVGQSPGVEDTTWMHRTAAVRDALWRTRPVRTQPLALLSTVDSADVAAMTGFLAQAASRRTPVLLDGLCVSASALLAEELAPGTHMWFLAAPRTTEPAHALALDHLAMEAMVDLGLTEGGGIGALAVLPLVTTAIQLTGV